jgi:ABC-type sugar transport system substrate-binding protein
MKARHFLTTIGMAALMLASGSAYAQDKMKVGFSQVGSESGWRAAETKVSKIEADKRGVDLRISDAQQKQENQIRAVRSFIAQGSTPSCSPRWWRRAGMQS